jgi:hypothetical protein
VSIDGGATYAPGVLDHTGETTMGVSTDALADFGRRQHPGRDQPRERALSHGSLTRRTTPGCSAA